MLETLLIIRIAMVMVKVNFSKRCACVFVCVCKSVHGWKSSVSFLSSDDTERDLVEIGGCFSLTSRTSLFFFSSANVFVYAVKIYFIYMKRN